MTIKKEGDGVLSILHLHINEKYVIACSAVYAVVVDGRELPRRS